MSNDTGVFVSGDYAGAQSAKPGSNGKNYRNHGIVTDPLYRAQLFSVEVGSDEDKALSAFEKGAPITVRVTPPYLGTSGAGNRYLAGFRVVEVVKEG